MTPPLSEISVQATVRLIPTKYYAPPVMRPLVDDDDALEILAALEGLTNKRLIAQTKGLSALDHRELAFNVWGQSHINAAFTYTRKEGNRFNSCDRGAWYASFDDLTAVAEVAYHKTRELIAINYFQETTVYQALLAGFIGAFHDLRQIDPLPPYLGDEPSTAYPSGQKLARDLQDQGGRGLVYPSVRKPGGTNLVAFHPHIVQNVRPGTRWKVIWHGSPDYTITTDDTVA